MKSTRRIIKAWNGQIVAICPLTNAMLRRIRRDIARQLARQIDEVVIFGRSYEEFMEYADNKTIWWNRWCKTR